MRPSKDGSSHGKLNERVSLFCFEPGKEKEIHKCLLAGQMMMLIMTLLGLPFCVHGPCCFPGAFTYALASRGPRKKLITSQHTEDWTSAA